MPTFRQTLVSSLTRRYPFFSGCGSLANHSFINNLAGKSAEVVWTRIAYGMHFLSLLDDYVGRAAYYVWELDRKITWICSRLIRQGDTVLDIGANLGMITLPMSFLVGKTGHVHAFEPNPKMRALLEQSISRNQASNVTLHRLAIGTETGHLELSVPSDNAGRGTLVQNNNAIHHRKISVPVKRLSDVLDKTSIAPIRLVKIDVEGFEPQVLQGAQDLFLSQKPDAILFELNDSHGSIAKHPTIEFLSDFGYDFFSIPKRMVRMQLNRFDPFYHGAAGSHDILEASRGENYENIARLVRARP